MNEPTKLIIIGSGPAGLTAAIYAARAGLKPKVIAGFSFGGQLMLTTEVENFPGFPNGVMGPELMNGMLKQAEKFGAEIICKNATKVDFSSKPFKVSIEEELMTAESVIIATGASPKWLGLSHEAELVGRGVSTCATCDAAFYRNLDVAVIGGGDTAMEEALVLSKFAKNVTIIHRRDTFRASLAMQEKVLATSNIKVVWNSSVIEYMYEGEINASINNVVFKGVKIQSLEGENFEIKVDGVFLAIGHKPMTDIFTNIAKDDNGYIKPVDGKVKTNIEGVFVCGDAEDHIYRQAIVASGSGCMAALEAIKFLD